MCNSWWHIVASLVCVIFEWHKNNFVYLAAAITHTHFAITCGEALIEVPIPNVQASFPLILWHLLWGLSNWHLWKSRCSLGKDLMIPAISIECKIWKDLSVYIRIEWRFLMGVVKEGRCTYDDAVAQMRKDFGTSGWIFLWRFCSFPPIEIWMTMVQPQLIICIGYTWSSRTTYSGVRHEWS